MPHVRRYLHAFTALTAATLACSSNSPGTAASGSTGSSSTGAAGGSASGAPATSGASGGPSSGDTGGGGTSVGSGTGSAGSSSASGGPSSGSTSGSGSGVSGSAGGSSSGGGTTVVDAGEDSAEGESGEAGGACGSSGVEICDDFEGVAAGATGSAWTIDNDGYTVETVTTMAHSGTHSVHVMAKGISGHGYIVETKTFPATDFWGRAYLLLQAPPSGHEVFVAFDGANDEQVRVLNDLGSGKIATNRRSDDQSKQSSQAYPMGTWACYEWHETPTELHVYFQGKELTDADEMWTEATLSLLRLGFERFDTGTGGDIYIDDVAVGSSQIGCN